MPDIDPALMAQALNQQQQNELYRQQGQQPQSGKGNTLQNMSRGDAAAAVQQQMAQQRASGQPVTGKGAGLTANMPQYAQQVAAQNAQQPAPQFQASAAPQPQGNYGKGFGGQMPQVPQQRYAGNFMRGRRQMGPNATQAV